MSKLRDALTVLCIGAFLITGAAAACVENKDPKESVQSLRAKSPTLRDKVRLRIGVRETLPFLSYRDPSTGIRSGFEVELARGIASDLGFTEEKIDWVPVTDVQSRMHVLQANQADIVVASLTMAPDRPVDFAGPYLVMPQAILVHKQRTKRVESIADLKAPDFKTCVGISSTSAKALEAKGIKPELVNDGLMCIDGMTSNKYDAYSSDLQVLASVLARDPDKFEILKLLVSDAEERIGVAVPQGDTALRDLVAYFLNRWLIGPQPSPWMRAYDRTIGPHLEAKYRSQPRVDKPPVLVDYDSKAQPR
ncbi:glutamate-binding protein [Rhizocola hellebori]|uniref:Glutamate-binding protein n=1 Tax=Rhizocola hellebori TaxID=1392758 RepID=A0A8J3Q8V5_9ACTN|nr:transporter substrate-binding domain-containing protein [Rhizocola hellebori]GIH05477.1 glutamate-binding protein [Rhizocola hellebori]